VAPAPTPIQQILKIIEHSRSFVVTGHERPDGDAVGSTLALWHFLKQLGKQAECVLRSGVPRRYAFLPGAAAVKRRLRGPAPEVLIVADCDGIQRVDVSAQLLRRAQRVVDIDHHGTNPPFGDVAYVDPSVCAVGEQVYRLLEAAEACITADIATCLYCAIGTDTGFFRFRNTTASALATCAKLVEAGADPSHIAQRAADLQPLSTMVLLGRALAGAEAMGDGAIVVARLLPEDFAAAGADPEETEGIIDRLKFIEGAQVAVLLRDEGHGEVRVSLRAADGMDVSTIARRFGGGGHPAAAGCTIRGTMQEAHAAIVSELRAAVV
jgi:phosphoesterase RecJ-like protein